MRGKRTKNKNIVVSCSCGLLRKEMDSSTIPLILVDGDSGMQYTINLNREDYDRANNDMRFAARLLEAHKKSLQETVILREEEQGAESTMDTGCSLVNNGDGSSANGRCSPSNDTFRWPDTAIKALIQHFKENEKSMLSGQITQKKFWERTSDFLRSLGYRVSGKQCSTKFTGLKSTYKSVKDHNNKSGNDLKNWPYFDLLDEIFGKRPFIQPLATLDSGKPNTLAERSETSSSEEPGSSKNPEGESPRPAKRKKTDIATKFLERLELNAEERRQRHMELMQRQDRLIEVLEKIANK